METLQQQTKTKAIKQHKCNFCYSNIDKKETYIKSVHKFDGIIYPWRTHEKCANIAQKLNMYDECDYGLDGDTFREYIIVEFWKISTDIKEKIKFEDQLSTVLTHYKLL